MQVDIRTFLERNLWKQNEGLLIPAHLTKRHLSALDVSSAVYLTHEEVFGEKYTQEDLEKDLSQLTVGDCISLTSKILTVLENEGRVEGEAQKSIAQELDALPKRRGRPLRLGSASDGCLYTLWFNGGRN